MKMKYSWHAALGCAVLAVLLLVSGCDAWTTAQGTVRDGAAKPIRDATVTLRIDGDSREFRSDKDGHYLVQLLQAPIRVDATLRVVKSGFVPYEKRLKGPGVYQPFDVVLEPEAVTPQSIAREMFPNAPEKTQSIDCFRGLKPAVSMNAIVHTCGRPDEELGSGVYIFVWHLTDGSTVSIDTSSLEKIGDIRYSDALGKSSSLFRRK
jgi:hypothetical protein